MIELLGLVLAFIILIAVSLGSLLMSAIILRVLIALMKAGPDAANQAYESGASLSKWWRGEHWPQTNWSKDI